MQRIFAASALCLTLGGCWYAEHNLLESSSFTAPPISGQFRLTNVHEGDATYWRATVSGIEAKIDYVAKDGSWKPDGAMRFMPFDSGYYLIEWDEEDYSEYFLGRLRSDGSFALIEPACDSSVLDAGLALYDEYEDACEFEASGDLVSAARELVSDLDAGRSGRVASTHELVPN